MTVSWWWHGHWPISVELACANHPQPCGSDGLEGGLGHSMMSEIGMQAPTGSAPMPVQGAAILPGALVQDASRNYGIWQSAREGIVAIK